MVHDEVKSDHRVSVLKRRNRLEFGLLWFVWISILILDVLVSKVDELNEMNWLRNLSGDS